VSVSNGVRAALGDLATVATVVALMWLLLF
jgi:hypothetical protein